MKILLEAVCAVVQVVFRTPKRVFSAFPPVYGLQVCAGVRGLSENTNIPKDVSSLEADNGREHSAKEGKYLD